MPPNAVEHKNAESEKVRKERELEVEVVRVVEGDIVCDALEIVTLAIALGPDYVSPYSNRTQVSARVI